MNITLSIDEQIVKRAREKLRVAGKSVNEEIRDHLQHVAVEDDMERSIELFVKNSGQGKPDLDRKWNRDELYEDRIKWPQK